MSRNIKIGLAVFGLAVLLAIGAIGVLFIGVVLTSRSDPWPAVRRDITLDNHDTVIVEGIARSRSEHGFSQRAGYQPAGSSEVEWFGDVSDGVQPQVYQAGPLVVVIDLPSGCLFVRNPNRQQKWKTLALVFPNDLGPSFPISYYVEQTGLTNDEVSRINELGGKRAQKWPTTYIQSFNSETRDLNCSYWLDNKNVWPLRLRLSEDGAHLALVEIGAPSR
jgi:hypothetical protein